MAKLGPDSTIQYVKGVGPRSATKLARLGVQTLFDLIHHIPQRYIDRRQISLTGDVELGSDRVVVGEVQSAAASYLGKRRVYRAIIDDSSGPIEALWFHFNPKYMKRQLAVGSCVLIAGSVARYGRHRQFVHPEFEAVESGQNPQLAAKIIPVYPATEGISQRLLRNAVATAWEQACDHLHDTLPTEIRAQHALMPRRDALATLHFPQLDDDIAALNERRSAAHRSLIFEESYLLELGLALRRAQAAQVTGPAIIWSEATAQQFAESLPFAMTAAQSKVLSDIAGDFARTSPMHRLVQGDVGSGKTVVAAAAAVQVAKAGGQVAVMAPTELLAEQHARSMQSWLQTMGIPHALLTGSTPESERQLLFDQLATGELPVIIGTHALLEDQVDFDRLALAVIDEQHRFGVAQRMRLQHKGQAPHVLVLTATPIPRSLAMTYYGDLEVSAIDALPPGRKPVMTKHYTEKQRNRMYQGLRHELQRGRQGYVVCPLVEESEHSDLRNASDMQQQVQHALGPDVSVGLLHGRMSTDDKAQVMQQFVQGELQVLVATTVVEVGVDVPNASVMIIEHAERFGLAQLHQLRGRVGRGDAQSYCVLMTPARISDEAKQRVGIMVETTDGFRIAEEDLRMRGPGEFLGTRQSGLPDLQFARILDDEDILAEAREAAFACIAQDAELKAQPDLRDAVIARWGAKLELGAIG